MTSTSGRVGTLPTLVLETQAVTRTDGETGNGNEERVGTRIDRKTERKKNGAEAGEPGPNRRAGKAGIVRSNSYRPVTITKENRPRRNPIVQGRSGQGLCRHDWRPRYMSRNTWWETESGRNPPHLSMRLRRSWTDGRPERRRVAARSWRPMRRSGLRRMKEVTHSMQYGQWRAKKQTCILRSHNE